MNNQSKKKVMVALSGGVDSSVAAYILKEQGHELFCVTLKTFCYQKEPASKKACCGLEGINAARAVAAQLGIGHTILDVSGDFQKDVIDDFVSEYASGRTPNPCVRCNATIKIPYLLEKARSFGCDYLATGHHAKVLETESGFAISRGADKKKDQAYFLWQVPPFVLERLLLPVGDYDKDELRKIALKNQLVTATREESQEICFVPDGDYVEFLKKFLPSDHAGFRPGKIISSDGKEIGKHDGYLGYTVGQRKGLGGGHKDRLYVTGIDASSGNVLAGKKDELLAKELKMIRLNCFVDDLSQFENLRVQIRHGSKEVDCSIVRQTEKEIVLSLMQSAYAVSPGQSAVLFNEERLLAGGVIV